MIKIYYSTIDGIIFVIIKIIYSIYKFNKKFEFNFNKEIITIIYTICIVYLYTYKLYIRTT